MGHTEAADALLSGSLLIMGFRKPSAYHVQLTSCAIKYSPLDNGIKSKDIPLNDVFGVDCMKGKLITDPIAYLTLYVYKRGKTLTGNVDFIRQRSVVVFMVADSPLFAENLHVAQMWKSMILKFSRPQVVGPRNHYSGTWLVLINPAGGQGKAVALFKERVVPIFAEAAIPFEVIVSDHGGHVCGIVRKMDLEKYSALITVSGDGLIHEVLNGLMSRPDWERAIRIPLGFIPAGSGNALAASIHEACGEPFKVDFVKHAALLLAKSTPVSMDVTYLENLVEDRYAFLSVGWGLVADIDIESEKFRALGESRFTVQALQRVLDLRTYSGTLSYLPASTLSRTETHSDYHLDAGLEKPRTDLLVPISDPVPEDWTKIEGDFISVYLSCISRLGVSSVGVPWAKLDDGLIYLYWITADAPKSAVASYLMDMASGEHLKSRYVAMVAVRAFRLEPKEKNGIMTVDGEKVQYGPMQGQVLPSLATVLSRSGS